MADGILQQFIQARGGLIGQRGQEIGQQGQQAEQDRFLETSNLRSIGIGALEALGQTDPASQDALLTRRIQEITSRGGDPRDTIEALNTPFEQRQGLLQNAVQIAQQAGVLQTPEIAKPVVSAEDAAQAAGLKEKAILSARFNSPEAKAQRERDERDRRKEEKDLKRTESERVKKEEAIRVEALGAVELITDLIGGTNAKGETVKGADLDLIFGREEQFKTRLTRSQAGLDLISKRKRIISLLELGAAGKLKGQGQITEAERRILKDSVALISDELISPELAAKEFERIRPIFEKLTGGVQPTTIGRFKIKVK